jgi:hypothetical protein
MSSIPKLYDLNLEEINSDLIKIIINSMNLKKDMVITPSSILGATGFPISDQTVMLNSKRKVRKIKQILSDLENSGFFNKKNV